MSLEKDIKNYNKERHFDERYDNTHDEFGYKATKTEKDIENVTQFVPLAGVLAAGYEKAIHHGDKKQSVNEFRKEDAKKTAEFHEKERKAEDKFVEKGAGEAGKAATPNVKQVLAAKDKARQVAEKSQQMEKDRKLEKSKIPEVRAMGKNDLKSIEKNDPLAVKFNKMYHEGKDLQAAHKDANSKDAKKAAHAQKTIDKIKKDDPRVYNSITNHDVNKKIDETRNQTHSSNKKVANTAKADLKKYEKSDKGFYKVNQEDYKMQQANNAYVASESKNKKTAAKGKSELKHLSKTDKNLYQAVTGPGASVSKYQKTPVHNSANEKLASHKLQEVTHVAKSSHQNSRGRNTSATLHKVSQNNKSIQHHVEHAKAVHGPKLQGPEK